MDVDLPAEDDPRRIEIRRWFEAHHKPSPRELVDAGFVVPHWPKPYGLDADPALQLIIEDPNAYAKPWGVNLVLEFFADEDMIENMCENERDYSHLVIHGKEESK
jgi:hypothetical protein